MPKGPRKFHFSFEKTGLTRFGGLTLLQSFCKSLGLRRFLQLYVRWPDYHYRDYHPVDLFLAHLFAIVAGTGRIESTQCLIHNGLIPPILGLTDFPHRDTLRTFLWRFSPKQLQRLQLAHDRLRHELFQRLGLLYSAIVDADTTTLITYGSQEGTALGYIPKRRHGQPSYAPILSSEGRSGLSLGMELRAGNMHASSGAWDFLEQILEKLPSSIASTRTRVRLDGAFYDKKIVESLDPRHLGYAIVARMSRPLRNKMVQARYHPVRPRLGGSRVYLHSLSLESRAPIRGRAKACGSGARRDPETAFHLQGLHLPPSFGHQLGADPGGGLALLLRPSFSGTVAPRVQGLLCNGQDSHAQLLGQRYLHGDALVGLRLGVGFPVSLPAKDSSALEHLHSAPRALVAACRMGQTGQSQPLDAPGEVSSSGTVPQNSAGRLENQTADLNRFATLLTARPLVGD